jgi:hypothetical protein
LESDEEEFEEFETQSNTDSADSDQSSTIHVATPKQPALPAPALPTPDDTPAPPESEHEAPYHPRQEIFGDPEDSGSILEGPRTRRPKDRYEAYLTDLAHPDELPALQSASALGTTAGNTRIHQDDIPPPPRSWKELKHHKFGKEFEEAAKKEYQSLQERGTFRAVPKTSEMKTIPLTWVFVYKFDTNGYVTKFKARIAYAATFNPKATRIRTPQRLPLTSFEP